MYFANMLGKLGVFQRGNDDYALNVKVEGVVENPCIWVDDNKREIVIEEAGRKHKKTLFDIEEREDGKIVKYKGMTNNYVLSYEDIEDTAENPLIVVLTSKLRFHNGVQTYMKYLNVNDEFMLAELVYGACDFYNGTQYIPMVRCYQDEVSERTIERTPEQMMSSQRMKFNDNIRRVDRTWVNVQAAVFTYHHSGDTEGFDSIGNVYGVETIDEVKLNNMMHYFEEDMAKKEKLTVEEYRKKKARDAEIQMQRKQRNAETDKYGKQKINRGFVQDRK